MKRKQCPKCGRFMSQVIGPGYDPDAVPASVPDYDCECGHASFETADRQQSLCDQKDAYERETGFRPFW
jgi:hypothetical protein